MNPRSIRPVCRRCRKPLDTLQWLETSGGWSCWAPARTAGAAGAGGTTCHYPKAPTSTRLRYGCGRHGQHRRTLNQLRGPVRGAAGIVKLAALEAAYTKAVERGDREILLPL